MSANTTPLPALPAHLQRAAARRFRRLPDFLMIASIVTLVVLTSLPRLRAFVLRSNEADAREMVLRLAATDLASDDLGAVFLHSPELRRSLQDGSLSEDGSLLCFHGFCFRVVSAGAPGADAPGADADEARARRVVAWPELAGESGVVAFLASSDGELWLHPNSDGQWSGIERQPQRAQPLAESGWRFAGVDLAGRSPQ